MVADRQMLLRFIPIYTGNRKSSICVGSVNLFIKHLPSQRFGIIINLETKSVIDITVIQETGGVTYV